jgi:hypothetical protein
MEKYQGNIEKLSDELYFMARNTKVTPSVRLQAITLFLEKCVPKIDYKEPERIWVIPGDLIEYYSKGDDPQEEPERIWVIPGDLIEYYSKGDDLQAEGQPLGEGETIS